MLLIKYECLMLGSYLVIIYMRKVLVNILWIFRELGVVRISSGKNGIV